MAGLSNPGAIAKQMHGAISTQVIRSNTDDSTDSSVKFPSVQYRILGRDFLKIALYPPEITQRRGPMGLGVLN